MKILSILIVIFIYLEIFSQQSTGNIYTYSSLLTMYLLSTFNMTSFAFLWVELSLDPTGRLTASQIPSCVVISNIYGSSTIRNCNLLIATTLYSGLLHIATTFNKSQ